MPRETASRAHSFVSYFRRQGNVAIKEITESREIQKVIRILLLTLSKPDAVRATTVTKVKIRQVLTQFLTFLLLMTTLLEFTVVIATHDIINHAGVRAT